MPRKPRGRGSFFGDNQGATAALGFLVGGGFFAITFVQVIDVSREDLQQAPQTANALVVQAEAHRLALQILEDPGTGWYAPACSGDGPLPLAFTPESVTRFGLGAEPCLGGDPTSLDLDYEKLRSLRRAGLEHDGLNQAVDYTDARHSLGLDGEQNFRIVGRITLSDVEERLRHGKTDENLVPLYIGDYTPRREASTGLPPQTCRSAPVDDGIEVTLAVKNDGVESTSFNVKFTLGLKKAKLEIYKFTPLLAPGEEAQVRLVLPKSSDWAWKDGAYVDIRVKDNTGARLGQCSVPIDEKALRGPEKRLIVYAAYYSLKEHLRYGKIKSKVVIEGRSGDGALVFDPTYAFEADGEKGPALTTPRWHKTGWKILPSDKDETSYALKLVDKKGNDIGRGDAFLPRGPQGHYVPPPPRETWTPGEAVRPETTYIDRLVASFEPNVAVPAFDHPQIPYAVDGDVLPDVAPVLAARLPALLLKDGAAPASSGQGHDHGHDNDDRNVTLCHVPPGNPRNAHTIDVGAPAVDAHLAHGDYLGPCKPSTDTSPPVECAAVDCSTPPPAPPATQPPVAGRGSLGNYNVIVLGSNLDPASLATPQTTDAISQWVQAGGLLIVLGHAAPSTVEEAQYAGYLGKAEGNLKIVDAAHPLLNVPNVIDARRLDDNGRAWRLGGPADPAFSLVAERGGATLAILEPGAFGAGRVIVTSYRPYSATGSGALDECAPDTLGDSCLGLKLLHNLLSAAYQDVNFAYGPTIPDHVAVDSVQRLVTVDHPFGTRIEVTVRVYVF